ncbi:hypothetical protein GIB67_000410 [Kingdonia uniflora]|uniref:DUF4283 domain-containing protein n=1 Tax=Kingdonia uniflora TaxID=39325 RepID=A0A7J7MPZ8_9MAGN|nr:hypothetical protein GIB67_000410 [Kingdonia uniflora]
MFVVRDSSSAVEGSDTWREFYKWKSSVKGIWGGVMEYEGRSFRKYFDKNGDIFYFLLFDLEWEKTCRGMWRWKFLEMGLVLLIKLRVMMDLWEMEAASKVRAVNNETHPSFANLLNPKSTNIRFLPVPWMSGEFPTIKIPEDGVKRGIGRFKFSLIGRLDLMKTKLAIAREAIWRGGPWHIDNQLLKVIPWVPNFDALKQKNSNAMVWIKFPRLPNEYWEEDILMSMARAIGNPVQVDESTLRRNTRFYASVLVDADFSLPIPTKIFVENDKYEFVQEVTLGRTPKVCSHCKVVGNTVSECRDVRKEIEVKTITTKEGEENPKKKKRNRKKKKDS